MLRTLYLPEIFNKQVMTFKIWKTQISMQTKWKQRTSAWQQQNNHTNTSNAAIHAYSSFTSDTMHNVSGILTTLYSYRHHAYIFYYALGPPWTPCIQSQVHKLRRPVTITPHCHHALHASIIHTILHYALICMRHLAKAPCYAVRAVQ